jgi:hypothetical protein
VTDLYVFAPIPRPGLWIYSSNPQPPPGHITLAAAALHRRRRPGRTELALSDTDNASVARGDLERLIALFARMEPEQRSHIVELARQLIESESVPEVS